MHILQTKKLSRNLLLTANDLSWGLVLLILFLNQKFYSKSSSRSSVKRSSLGTLLKGLSLGSSLAPSVIGSSLGSSFVFFRYAHIHLVKFVSYNLSIVLQFSYIFQKWCNKMLSTSIFFVFNLETSLYYSINKPKLKSKYQKKYLAAFLNPTQNACHIINFFHEINSNQMIPGILTHIRQDDFRQYIALEASIKGAYRNSLLLFDYHKNLKIKS